MVEENNKLIAEFMDLEYFPKAKYKSDLYEAGDQAGEWKETDIYVLNPTKEFNERLIFGCYADEDYYDDKKPYDEYYWSVSYSSSWDWLIPVIEKIESLGYFCMINKWSSVYTGSQSDRINITTVEGKSKIENTHKAVTIFIKWYNKEKENGKD